MDWFLILQWNLHYLISKVKTVRGGSILSSASCHSWEKQVCFGACRHLQFWNRRYKWQVVTNNFLEFNLTLRNIRLHKSREGLLWSGYCELMSWTCWVPVDICWGPYDACQEKILHLFVWLSHRWSALVNPSKLQILWAEVCISFTQICKVHI